MYIKAYSELMAYLAYSEAETYLARFRYYSRAIHAYSGPYLSRSRHISRIFRHIHKGTHIELYLPTLGFRHIQDPGIADSKTCKATPAL